MPGYDFQVSLTLENKDNKELVVRIPRGSLIEPTAAARTQQSAVVKRDYVFRLNPKEVRPVIIEAECWNRHLSPPASAPGKITPFSGKVQTTTQVWAVSGNSAAGTMSTPPLSNPTIPELVLQVGGAWAREAFKYKVDKNRLDRAGPTRRPAATALKRQIDRAGDDRKKLKDVIDKAEINMRLTASDLREWLISSDLMFGTDGELTDFSPLGRFISLLYANLSHDLSSALFREAKELEALRSQLAYSVSAEKKKEIRDLMQSKILSIVDAFPEV